MVEVSFNAFPGISNDELLTETIGYIFDQYYDDITTGFSINQFNNEDKILLLMNNRIDDILSIIKLFSSNYYNKLFNIGFRKVILYKYQYGDPQELIMNEYIYNKQYSKKRIPICQKFQFLYELVFNYLLYLPELCNFIDKYEELYQHNNIKMSKYIYKSVILDFLSLIMKK